ncbi:hypothetical protein EYF80_003260 [Liparis tanakae]|uniref:Uncharacterized protein n=1 Tax=Liparis tanakae TaxID=230148 RepID=A0A4Z2J8R2_9TELE|nr:hypothetical protein EYF80_003260 [Liparis tanakae]
MGFVWTAGEETLWQGGGLEEALAAGAMGLFQSVARPPPSRCRAEEEPADLRVEVDGHWEESKD